MGRRVAIPDIQFQRHDSEDVRLEKLRRLATSVQDVVRAQASIEVEQNDSGGLDITITGPAVLGRESGTGSPEALTGAEVAALLPTFTVDLKGLVPPPGTATNTRFLRDDGSWATVTLASAYAAPSALVGLAAIPGTATTGIRSDGAPALDQGIEPFWTGQHEFTLVPTVGGFEVVISTRAVNTIGYLTGGGDLSANRTIAFTSNASLAMKRNIGAAFTTGDGSTALTSTVNNVMLRVPFAGTITKVTLLTEGGPGNVIIDIWKDTYANFPPTVADTITASAKPTIAADVKYEDSTLTGWTTAVAAGDVLVFHVDSVTTFHTVHVILEITPT